MNKIDVSWWAVWKNGAKGEKELRSGVASRGVLSDGLWVSIAREWNFKSPDICHVNKLASISKRTPEK